jgi:hypothetical protein
VCSAVSSAAYGVACLPASPSISELDEDEEEDDDLLSTMPVSGVDISLSARRSAFLSRLLLICSSLLMAVVHAYVQHHDVCVQYQQQQ